MKDDKDIKDLNKEVAEEAVEGTVEAAEEAPEAEAPETQEETPEAEVPEETQEEAPEETPAEEKAPESEPAKKKSRFRKKSKAKAGKPEETGESEEAPAEEKPEETGKVEEAAAKAAKKEKRKGRGKKILKGLGIAAVAFSVVSSFAFWGLMFSFGGMLDDGDGGGWFHGPTRENDVVIADAYTIKDTTAISDAYKAKGDEAKEKIDALDETQKETLDMASAVLKDIIKDDMTDLEKEKAVYDWMIKNIRLDDSVTELIGREDPAGEPYGALKNRKAVCAGYATTFRLFMQMLDIDCKVCHDTAKIHSWDLVKIGDHWYHVDIYTDTSGSRYAHFNINDSLMADEEDWDTRYFPKADSLEANLFYKKRVTISKLDELPAAIRKALKAHQTVLYVVTKEPMTEEEQMLVNNMIIAIGDALMNDNPYNGAPDMATWPGSETRLIAGEEDGEAVQNVQEAQEGQDGENLMVITLSYYDQQTPEKDLPDGVDQEKIKDLNKALKENFGDVDESIHIEM